MPVVWNLLLSIKDRDGVIEEKSFVCDSEREADELQLDMLAEQEEAGGEVLTASVCRERT